MTRFNVLAGVMGAVVTARPLHAQHAAVPLVLNHLEVVLDSATFHDINTSAFVRDNFAASATVHEPMHAGMFGLRLFGKYNWLTFGWLGSLGHADGGVGDVSISLGTEVPGALAMLARVTGMVRYSTAPGVTDARPMTRDYLVDFLDLARLTGADSTSSHTWFEVMQYSSDGAKLLAQADSQPATNLTNARFLAPYYDRHKLFEYVSGATLAIPVGDIAKIVAVLKRDSVPVIAEGEGAIIQLNGFTLHLIPPWTGAGVKLLTFALTREVDANPTYRFGPRSQLRFGPGAVAVWDFNRP